MVYSFTKFIILYHVNNIALTENAILGIGTYCADYAYTEMLFTEDASLVNGPLCCKMLL